MALMGGLACDDGSSDPIPDAGASMDAMVADDAALPIDTGPLDDAGPIVDAAPDAAPVIVPGGGCPATHDFVGELGPVDPDDFVQPAGGVPSFDAPDPAHDSGLRALVDSIPLIPGEVRTVDVRIEGAIVSATHSNNGPSLHSDRWFWLADGRAAIKVWFDYEAWAQRPPFALRVGDRVSLTVTEVLNFRGAPEVTGVTDWRLDGHDATVHIARRGGAVPLTAADVNRMVAVTGRLDGPTSPCGSGILCRPVDVGSEQPAVLRYDPFELPDLTDEQCITFVGPLGVSGLELQLDAVNGRWVDAWASYHVPPAVEPLAAPVSPAPPAVTWTPCTLLTDAAAAPVADAAQCAEVDVPARWDTLDGPTLSLFVKRVDAREPPARGSLWLLAGGPGQSGLGLEPIVADLQVMAPDLDVYLLDHRGAGRSNLLDCPALGLECVDALVTEHGEVLPTLTLTGAALDLLALRRWLPPADQPAYALGFSYGTAWAHRALQIDPDAFTAVVLDSPALAPIDVGAAQQALGAFVTTLLDACAADADCAERLGDDPAATLLDTLNAMERDHCADVVAMGISGPVARVLMGQLSSWPGGRGLALSLAYRLVRCDADDVAAMAHLVGVASTSTPADEQSVALWAQVAGQELLLDPPDWLELMTEWRQGLMIDQTPGMLLWAHYRWPRTVDDAWRRGDAETDAPVLLLYGEMDPISNAPLIERARAVFDGPNHWAVGFPGLGHGTLFDPRAAGCADAMVAAFLRDPTTAPDVACAAALPAVDLAPDAELAEMLFGTPDAWGDGATKAARDPNAVRRAAARLLRPLRWPMR